ncbi:P2Y purinoceptor 11 [Alosa pseudoharengus]|uniref:P2Y purinoceptor 11 n=1 Tax=Alosa pseudoharengus TaxID=34774 RepID=UPI003F8BCF57
MESNNSENCTSFQVKLLPPLFGIEFFVALVGNLFALCLLLIKERKNWHTGVVFSFNLAISDVLYVLTLPLLIVYYARERDWTFGAAICKIERFLFTCNLYGSIFFIMCISVNRWVAIVHPFFTRSYVRPKHAKIAGVLVWVAVIAISSPIAVFADTCNSNHPGKFNCVSCCNDRLKKSHFKYKLFLALMGCMVPLLVTFSSYVSLIWVIYKNANITLLEKRKVALMVVSVLVLYLISFVPYHILQMFFSYNRIHEKVDCLVYSLYQVSKGLVTLNMCIHPILYMAVFDSIRVACCGETESDKS